MIVYLNGSFLDATEASISLFDGGYLHGDGLSATVRLYRGRPFDMEGQLNRFAEQLELLEFSWSPDPAQISEVITELLDRNQWTGHDAYARLTISRSNPTTDPLLLTGWRDQPPTFSLVLYSLPADLSIWQQEGIQVQMAKSTFARGNLPQLATLNMLPALLALRAAQAAGYREALLTDRRGKVLEGVSGSLFLVSQGLLKTPATRLGLLPRRARALVLAAAKRLGHTCEEVALDRGDLLTADELFLVCSVWEIVPVVGIEKARISDGKPGPVTRLLQKKYRQDVEVALAETPA
jgi:branched-subunit amino acid aminotransferase/4-amino-4-deoxychorismate lyase